MLGQAADVEIYIYDVIGNRVRMLQFGQKASGIYHDKVQAAYWDGENDANWSQAVSISTSCVRVQRPSREKRCC